METQYSASHSYSSAMKMTIPPSQHADNDRSTTELRALDCNLTSLCDHIQIEGFNSGAFSDIVVHAMGSTYHLHRLILSRSSYFRSGLFQLDKDGVFLCGFSIFFLIFILFTLGCDFWKTVLMCYYLGKPILLILFLLRWS